MTTVASRQIRSALQEENRSRALRGGLLGIVLALIGAGFVIATGMRSSHDSQGILAAAVAAGFVLLGISTAFPGAARLGRASALAVGLVGISTPFLAAGGWLEADGTPGKTVACTLSVVVVGAAGLLATRFVLGALRRRFGGATQLQALGAALLGALAVGLHCPLSSAAHLTAHVVGAALVAWGLRRFLLR